MIHNSSNKRDTLDINVKALPLHTFTDSSSCLITNVTKDILSFDWRLAKSQQTLSLNLCRNKLHVTWVYGICVFVQNISIFVCLGLKMKFKISEHLPNPRF